MIERNIVSGHILDDNKLEGLVKYDKFYEYGFNPEIVNKLFSSGKMEELLHINDELLDKESLYMKKIIKKCIIFLDKDNPFVKNHQSIKTHFFEKRNQYEKEDINKVYESLLDLGVDSRLCNAIREVLQRNLEKRQKQEAKENILSQKRIITRPEIKQKYLSEKEYKTLRKEIAFYFDLYTAMPTKDLSIDEILYCASLLFKIGAEDCDVRALYDRSSYTKKLLKRAQEQPITTYLQVYQQLKFYEEGLQIEERLSSLEDDFKNTFLADSSDYSILKEIIAIDLVELLEKIPTDYEYELRNKPQYTKQTRNIKVGNTKKR